MGEGAAAKIYEIIGKSNSTRSMLSYIGYIIGGIIVAVSLFLML